MEIEIGYNGSSSNSYTLVIHIRTHRPMADDQIADLCELLAKTGHFNKAENRRSYSGSLKDFTWVYINDWDVIERGYRIGAGTAKLMKFERRRPGLLSQ